jgi:hypothetical protein
MEQLDLDLDGGVASPSDVGGVSAPAVEVTDNDMKSIRGLRLKLAKYKTQFPAKLAGVSFEGVDSSTDLNFLEEKYNDVRLTICHANGGLGMAGMAYFTGLGALEGASKFTGLIDLDGLSKNCMMNPEISDCLKEINIEWCDFGVIDSPEKRLMMATVMACWGTNQMNSARKSQPAVLPNNTPPTTAGAPPSTAIGHPVAGSFYELAEKATRSSQPAAAGPPIPLEEKYGHL